jgi:hypothetical protein
MSPSGALASVLIVPQILLLPSLNPGFLAVNDDFWDEVFELCYIPVFGGGFGIPLQDAKKMSVPERRRMLKWLSARREEDMKDFKSSSGGTGSGTSSWKSANSMPTVTRPKIPKR